MNPPNGHIRRSVRVATSGVEAAATGSVRPRSGIRELSQSHLDSGCNAVRHLASRAMQQLVAGGPVAAHASAAALSYGDYGFTPAARQLRSPTQEPAAAAREPDSNAQLSLTAVERERFHALYRDHFDFVFRNLRRLGVAPASVDDALQDVYLVVLRRIRDLRHDAHMKAWLFAIIFRVAGNHRRSVRRRGQPESLSDLQLPSTQPGPFDLAARAQASVFLHDFLTSLDDNRRAVFVMAELEQLTVPEISRALNANVNTVYSWLRAGRLAFARALQDAQDASVHQPSHHQAGRATHG